MYTVSVTVVTSSTRVCMQVVQALRDKPKAWHLGSAGALVSQEREYKALHEVKNMKVRCWCTHGVAAKCFCVCSQAA